MSIDSDISYMRSKIATERAINSQLRSELYQLSAGVENASNAWNRLSSHITGTLSNGANRVNNSHELTLRAYEMEGEIEKMYALYKNVERANKKIRECKNRIYYEFSNYRAVRKIVEALLNNVEVNFVSDRTLAKAIEVKHLQLPDYWLTCALLAIMAWKNDDKALADRALKRACQLDLSNTSVFFFAFHLKLDKNDAALKWFRSYISCEHTGEEQRNILLLFSIVCSTLKENGDDAIIDEVNNFINELLTSIVQKAGYSEDEVVQKIMCCLNVYKVNEPIDYPVLSKYCTEKEYLVTQLNSARTNLKYLEMILKIVNVTAEEKSDYLNKFIDDVIVRANKAEKDVDREIIYNEYIISYQGDIESAKACYDDYIKHNESELNIENEMIDWIYYPDENVGNAERKKMFFLTKRLHEAAITNNVNNYRKKYKRNLNIKINEYETNADFTQQSSETAKVDTYFKDKERRLLSEVKLWPCFIWFGIAVLAIIGAIILGIPVLFVLAAVGVAGGVLKIITSNRRKEKIIKDCAIESGNTKETLLKLFDEFQRYENEYLEADRYFEDIQSEFSKI